MNESTSTTLSISLHKNIKQIEEAVNKSSDLKIRSFTIDVVREAAILYIDGITDTRNLQENILQPLQGLSNIRNLESIVSERISIIDAGLVTKFNEIYFALTKGKALVLIDGFDQGILADSADWQIRALSEPDTQRTGKGSLIGFNEQLKVNVNLLRSLIQTPDFTVESISVGTKSKTDVAIVYIEEFVDKNVLEETRKRIKEIDVTYLLEARVIEDAIEEKKVLFPLVFTCERPDVSVSALYEGRTIVIVNGTPYVLIVPTLFIHYFQQPDEYTMKGRRFIIRFLRFFSWLLSILLLGLYATVVQFHQDWFPHKFSKDLLTQSDTLLPLPLEILFLQFIFDLLSETSLRIPKSTVLLVSLIGATVVGQTSVDAKIVHSLSLIVVGISFLTSMSLTAGGLWGVMSVLRILFLLIGYYFGLTGMAIGLIITIIYIANLKSVGVPYLAPFFPFQYKEFKDVLFRGDLRSLINSKHTYPHKDKK
ncbi:spore germination protein [Bacillus sp. AFS017336]|uniref:spore germination protein n=1 Tax=Bacillus sp. AFS017336 TaxID=2033489 RepID=UPI000BF14B34|nr:spore germination protein [Bacillus sp. AFS017336]PEL13410.1 spore gernimation protein GerA [Bacillus sp. AFS017336]